MTYSLNMTDPFADDEDAVLVVPQDRPEWETGRVSGIPLVFIGPDTERPGWKMFMERRCGKCGRCMVIPDQHPTDVTRFAVVCPRRHESETVEAPDGFERYTDTARLFDLAKMREAEAWA